MKNIINYFYNLNLLSVYELNDRYYFIINNLEYFFVKFNRPLEDIKIVFDLYQELNSRNILVNDIITNKDNSVITMVNNIPYILLLNKVKNRVIDMNDILYMENNTINISKESKLYRTNWINLWSMKLDYYEKQMNEILKKYPILYNSIDYYIGLGENAISYLVNNKYVINNTCVSHKRVDIDLGSFDFYNPVNLIIDSRVRDFSEYIKNMFFKDKMNFDILEYYLNYMNFSKDEYVLLISRLLFPTYYFDIYDKIINNDLDEKIINRIINKTMDYILFLKKSILFIVYNKKINISFIEWILNINP